MRTRTVRCLGVAERRTALRAAPASVPCFHSATAANIQSRPRRRASAWGS